MPVEFNDVDDGPGIKGIAVSMVTELLFPDGVAAMLLFAAGTTGNIERDVSLISVLPSVDGVTTLLLLGVDASADMAAGATADPCVDASAAAGVLGSAEGGSSELNRVFIACLCTRDELLLRFSSSSSHMLAGL
jgi:hypothetical protein